MTICKDCRYFIETLYKSSLTDKGICLWFRHYCKASPLPRKRSYYDGEVEPQKYHFCRDVNDGNCEMFKKKRG